MRPFLTAFFFCYILIFILTFSFPYHILPDAGSILDNVFESLAHWSGTHVFGLHDGFTSRIISDSKGFYIHALHIVIFSIACAALIRWYEKKYRHTLPIRRMLVITCRTYLALQLSVYGFNKLFMLQFFEPEVNTLFTDVGQLSPDILYWTAMGSSPAYNVFMGMVEVIAAMLLLTRKAWIAGALLASGIMLNVLAINFSFDISVKLYASFLLLNALLLLFSQRRILSYIVHQSPAYVQALPKTTKTRPSMRALMVLLVTSEGIYPALYNHGHKEAQLPSKAYEVTNDLSSNVVSGPTAWKRIFLHTRGYLIVQYTNDTMHDYRYIWSSDQSEMTLLDGETHAGSIRWNKDHISGKIEETTLSLELKELDMTTLPIMTSGFNWTLL